MTYAVRRVTGPKDIILLEGRLNQKIIKELISDKK